MKWQEAGENCIIRSPIICTLHFSTMIVARRKSETRSAREEMKNANKSLVGKHEGKRLFG